MASIVIGLALCEAVLRQLDLGFGSAPLESHPVLHHVHPAHYRFRVHTPSGEYGGHSVSYDERGRVSDPDRATAPAPGAQSRRLACFGDSFVEAHQVPFEKSFCRLLEDPKTQFLTTNFGVSSYSPVLSLLQWKTDATKSPFDVVIE